MRKIFLLVSFTLMISSVFAQKGRASITVFNDQKSPVESATVELLRSKDSALIKTALTDKAGLAQLENIVFNSYVIRVSAVGCATSYTEAFTLSENHASIELPFV